MICVLLIMESLQLSQKYKNISWVRFVQYRRQYWVFWYFGLLPVHAGFPVLLDHTPQSLGLCHSLHLNLILHLLIHCIPQLQLLLTVGPDLHQLHNGQQVQQFLGSLQHKLPVFLEYQYAYFRHYQDHILSYIENRVPFDIGEEDVGCVVGADAA